MDKKAIIFDMDGVIVDTEFQDFRIQQQFIMNENQGILQDNAVDYTVLVGKSYDDLYQTINHFINKDYSLSEVKEKFETFNTKMYKNMDYQALFRADVIPILKYAKENGILLAVASSSDYYHILEVLETCGIKDYFDVIYSGEFVKESKPNPAIYKNTLDKLGVTSNNAVAIEDSFYGITAAKKAGITTIAYKEERMKIDQSHADFIGNDMKEVKLIISNIFNKIK